MRKLVLILGIVGLAAASPSPSQAVVEVGAVVAWHDNFDLGVGARASLPIEAISETVSGVGEILFFFPEDGGGDASYWEFNGNLLHNFVIESSSVTPYAGAGINVAYYSFSYDSPIDGPFGGSFDTNDTDIGINIIGGVAAKNKSYNPFVEAKVELGGGDSFVITFGASVPLGGDN